MDREGWGGKEEWKSHRGNTFLNYGVCFFGPILIGSAQVGTGPFLNDTQGHLIPVAYPFLVAELRVGKTAAVLTLSLCSQPYLHLTLHMCALEHHPPLCRLPVPTTQLCFP